MAQQPGAHSPNGRRVGEQLQGPGQAAAGAGGSTLPRRGAHQGSRRSGLGHTSLVIGQGRAEGAIQQGSIGAAEQQRAGGAIQGDGRHPGPERRRQRSAQADQPRAPGLGLLKRAGVRGSALRRNGPMAVDQGEPQTAAAQINAKTEGLSRRLRRQRG